VFLEEKPRSRSYSELEIKHIKTLLDHMDWEGGIGEVKYLLASVKELGWL
jgi:hypothetical protein